MIIYNEVIAHPKEPGWFIIMGEDTEDLNHVVNHHFSLEALQWKSAEYGIPESDVDTLFKIVFSDAIDVHHWTEEEGVIHNPYEMKPSAAWKKKQSLMKKVASRQNSVQKKHKVTIEVDREDLCSQFKNILEGGIEGVDLEIKKVWVYAARGGDEELRASNHAMGFLNAGFVNSSEAAIVAGHYLHELDKQSGVETEKAQSGRRVKTDGLDVIFRTKRS